MTTTDVAKSRDGLRRTTRYMCADTGMEGVIHSNVNTGFITINNGRWPVTVPLEAILFHFNSEKMRQVVEATWSDGEDAAIKMFKGRASASNTLPGGGGGDDDLG